MPMYEMTRTVEGTQVQTYRVKAEDKQDAERLIEEGYVEPQTEYFDVESDATVKGNKVVDCTCDTCVRRGPWSCLEDEYV